jgi:hypothetical protein
LIQHQNVLRFRRPALKDLKRGLRLGFEGGGQRFARMDVELFEAAAHMRRDRVRAEPQPLRHLFVAKAGRDLPEISRSAASTSALRTTSTKIPSPGANVCAMRPLSSAYMPARWPRGMQRHESRAAEV